jgi:hypothetical protein
MGIAFKKIGEITILPRMRPVLSVVTGIVSDYSMTAERHTTSALVV